MPPEVLYSVRPSRRNICAVPQDRTHRGVAFTTDTAGAKRVLWEQIQGRLIERC